MINQKECEFEQIIVKASRAGFLSEEIKEHIKNCGNCGETLKVANWLHMSARAFEPKTLPTAGFLWWKSRIIEKRRAAENTAKPILITQTVAAVVAFGTLVWLTFNPAVKFASVGDAFNQVFASIESVAVPLVAGVICFTLICSMIILTLLRFLLEK